MMRFNRKADQGDKGGDGSRSSRKLWEAVEMAELEVFQMDWQFHLVADDEVKA